MLEWVEVKKRRQNKEYAYRAWFNVDNPEWYIIAVSDVFKRIWVATSIYSISRWTRRRCDNDLSIDQIDVNV